MSKGDRPSFGFKEMTLNAAQRLAWRGRSGPRGPQWPQRTTGIVQVTDGVAGLTVAGAGKDRGGPHQGERCRLAGQDCARLAHGEEGSSRGRE